MQSARLETAALIKPSHTSRYADLPGWTHKESPRRAACRTGTGTMATRQQISQPAPALGHSKPQPLGWHTRTSRQRRLSMGTCASRHTICELNVDVDMFGESESGSVLGVAHRHMQPVSCRDRRVLAVSPEQGRSLYPAT